MSVFELVVYEAGKVIIQTGPIHYNRILGEDTDLLKFGLYATRPLIELLAVKFGPN